MPSPRSRVGSVVVMSGGVGGARFLRGLKAHLAASGDAELQAAEVVAVVNTGDDATFNGLHDGNAAKRVVNAFFD